MIEIESSTDLPIVEEVTPAPDPWDAFLKLRTLDGVIFLDSAMKQRDVGRYSFITADPFTRVTLSHDPDAVPQRAGDPFAELRRTLAAHPAATVPGLPPFQGGAAGLLSYELGRRLERLPRPQRTRFQFPDMVIGIHDWVLAFDHDEERAWIISHGFPADTTGSRRFRARERIESILAILAGVVPPTDHDRNTPQNDIGGELRERSFPVDGCPGLLSNFSKERYLEAVQQSIEYIHAGDVFQVNLSQQLYFPETVSPVELYHQLRTRNPATFAGYFAPAGEDFTLVSASPERFVRISTDGVVETRPIKGTRPRKTFAEEDRFSRDELRESAKDRSENVMIVDLLRNDISRVCSAGSVEVPSICGVETYPSIHHLVSVVRGRLSPGCDSTDLLAATFPGGSITGAPKIRAMEIICELEPDARGPYCGALGYIGFDGAMDTSVLIRTVTVSRGWLQFPVGGGIVADSSPRREYQETLDKARGILWALE